MSEAQLHTIKDTDLAEALFPDDPDTDSLDTQAAQHSAEAQAAIKGVGWLNFTLDALAEGIKHRPKGM